MCRWPMVPQTTATPNSCLPIVRWSMQLQSTAQIAGKGILHGLRMERPPRHLGGGWYAISLKCKAGT
eukprot:363736-Chlamydomonas_euryale.AAC.11